MTDRYYRYSLWSQWASGGRVLNVIGLNPSTADDLGGTVRRCIALAKHHGFDALNMTNLFARRAITRASLRSPLILSALRTIRLSLRRPTARQRLSVLGARLAACTVGMRRWRSYSAFMLRCFGVTKDGHPRHPLYLPTNTPLMAYPDVKLCRIHDLREPCPDCMTPNATMIGLITHIRAVADRIPKVLKVSRTVAGSQAVWLSPAESEEAAEAELSAGMLA